MKLFVPIFACLAAVASAKSALQQELEHKLDLAQGPLMTAMFDYQNRGYRYFTQQLAHRLNEITLMRHHIEDLTPEHEVQEGEKLSKDVKLLVDKIPGIIKDPAPHEIIKARALYLAQIDIQEKNEESKTGRPQKLNALVTDIVNDEVLMGTSGILTPEAIKVKEQLPAKYEQLSKMIFNQKIPTIDEIQAFIPLTEKKLEGLKFLPDHIAEALFWTDILNAYRMLAYSTAQMLPIDSPQKIAKYSHDIGEFHKILFSVYKFDLEGMH